MLFFITVAVFKLEQSMQIKQKSYNCILTYVHSSELLNISITDSAE